MATSLSFYLENSVFGFYSSFFFLTWIEISA